MPRITKVIRLCTGRRLRVTRTWRIATPARRPRINIKRYGIRLLPELYAHLNPMPFEAAAQMEQDLAEDLRRRRLARKLNCAASMVPDALVCYATIYALGGLMILLYLGGLIVVFGD